MTRDSMEKTDSQAANKLPTSRLGRRSALKLGAGVAPILMTLASRSAFSCHSTTPSAFGSINASRPDVLKALTGKSPTYWEENTGSNWPSSCKSHASNSNTATTFKATFGSVCSGITSSTTLLSVLKNHNGGQVAVARACVAALLNAKSNRTSSVLPESAVIQMWSEFISRSYYEPTAGVKWYANSPALPANGVANTGGKGGILGYLNTTWL